MGILEDDNEVLPQGVVSRTLINVVRPSSFGVSEGFKIEDWCGLLIICKY
jgi:hypothetical protein